MNADLLVICVTRGRPRSVTALWESWQATSDGRADLLFAVDDDDPELGAYRAARPAGTLWHEGPRLRLAGTLNAVALEYAGEYRMLGSWGDDHRPRTAGWDTRFATALDRMGSGVAYGNDLLAGERIPTAVVLTSDIVAALGYMAAPGMTHLYIDNVWKDWGQAMGRLAYLPDVVVEHCHPAARKVPMDDGYRDANSARRVREDQAGYHAYKAQRFEQDMVKLRALVGQ